MGAKKIEVIYDSLTNKEIEDDAYNKVPLVVNGVSFTLYLTPDSEKKFNADVEKWTQNEEPEPWQPPRTKPAKTAATKSPARTDKAQLQAMRDWARENGFTVSDRGRIAQEIQDAYHATH